MYILTVCLSSEFQIPTPFLRPQFFQEGVRPVYHRGHQQFRDEIPFFCPSFWNTTNNITTTTETTTRKLEEEDNRYVRLELPTKRYLLYNT